MSPTSASCIEELVGAGHTLRALERDLGLSRGYLSKIRHGAVRPSPQLAALLEVVRQHPLTLETIRRATGAGTSLDAGAPEPLRALDVLRDLTASLHGRVRWAVTGDAALRLHGAEPPDSAGVDIVVDRRDRHVLQLLRDRGLALAHHPPDLAIVELGSSDPNENLRIWFPSRPPLDGALEDVEERDGLPVVDLETLAVALLLSQRAGSEASAGAAVRAGVSVERLRQCLEALSDVPEPRSPYVLRLFDRALARRRLEALA